MARKLLVAVEWFLQHSDVFLMRLFLFRQTSSECPLETSNTAETLSWELRDSLVDMYSGKLLLSTARHSNFWEHLELTRCGLGSGPGLESGGAELICDHNCTYLHL